MLAGFLQPDGGEIRVDGKVISSPTHSGAAGAAQHVDDLSKLRGLAAHDGGAKRRLRPQVQKAIESRKSAAKVTKLLGVVRLAELKDRYSAELSGGQQQRVALARALVVEPHILLMDEPLSNLDANLREEMRFEIRRLHEEFDITTIYVTHDQAEAMATSDRIAVLNRGRLIQVGPPSEIFDRPQTRFVAEFVGKANILSGRVNSDGDGRSILSDGVKIRLADGGAVAPASEVSVCLRPHNIKLVAGRDAVRQLADQGYNLFPGIVRRSIYFGDAVDYTVELASGRVLHVIAPPSQRFEPGQSICAAAHAENCVIVSED